jgi:hypothetical protein
MNACGNCDRIDGVGDFSGIVSGIGNWFSSGLGAELLKAGLSFGVGYGVSRLQQSQQHQQQQPSLTGGTTVNPAGSVYIPQAQAPQQQSLTAGSPDWLLPVSILGAAAVLVMALKR